MKILVAEDEQDISSLYRRALEERAHEVIITANGEECIEVYRRQHQDLLKAGVPDVVILDYRMPKMDGLQAAKEILKLNPNQRIIFASAYVKDTLVESVKELNRVVEMVQKPFTMSTMADIVEDREAYEGLKTLMANVKKITDFDNPSSNEIKVLFEGLRKVQRFRAF